MLRIFVVAIITLTIAFLSGFISSFLIDNIVISAILSGLFGIVIGHLGVIYYLITYDD